MGDGIDPQPRLGTRRDRQIETLVVTGDVGEDLLEIVCQQFQPRELRFADIDDDVVPVREGVLHVANGIGQTAGRRRAVPIVYWFTHELDSDAWLTDD